MPTSEEQQQRAYLALNASVLPVWAAMILAPRSRLTSTVVGRSTPLFALLGATYAAGLARALSSGEVVDFRSAESTRAALARPEGFLAGWNHYLVFDLFVGRWIWSTAVAEGRRCRLALLLTWLAGPSGLLVFLAQRRSLR